ncbi:CLUMA_CG001638, isoform A [Clunio marinus]|uniref:CLUMA_CG001638, isoform A n=1 Tax=Clunio marinus TaxID=568069 RepID=A0A1J1HIV8_9DIPT|nr:CLUMA_CG001638, isoform A [Clunio marinus]
MRDLGIIFDNKLSFNEHVEMVCSKAKRMLGFIMRVGKYFNNILTFVSLYNSLVRSNLEYASVIWNPHTATQKLKLERVQHKFLRFVAHKCFGFHYGEDMAYEDIERRARIDNLEFRRTFIDLKFMTKAFNGTVDFNTFNHHFHYAPIQATRSTTVFKTTTSKTDTGKYSLFNRLMRSYNAFLENDRWLSWQPTNNQIKHMIRSKQNAHN